MLHTPESSNFASRTPRIALSSREKEVLEQLARGMTDDQTAEKIGISKGTVRVYRKRIEEKMGTRGLLPSLLIAWRRGDIDLAAIAEEVEGSPERSPKGRRSRSAEG